MLKKGFLLILVSAILPSLKLWPTSVVSLNKITPKAASVQIDKNEQNELVVFSYKDILYKQYSDQPELKDVCTFDEFCDGYYQQGKELQDYISCLLSESSSINSVQVSAQETSSVNVLSGSIEIFSPDADYIMDSNINDSASTASHFFKRVPEYKSFDRSKVQIGDIVLERKDNNAIGHLAFISNTSHSGYYGNYVQTIESVASGVQYGFLDDRRIIDYQVTIYRVYRATELGVTNRALDFLKNQLGKDYSIDYRCTHVGNQEKWYCSELIYAAYYDANMDILYDPTASPSYFDYQNCPFVPTFLENRFFGGQVLDILNVYYIDFFQISFANSKWTITVFNPNGFTIDLEYNSKMCFSGDAIGWNLSSDVKTLSLNPGQSGSICVSENFMATTVATSFCYQGKRYITYADKLNKGNFTFNKQNAMRSLL